MTNAEIISIICSILGVVIAIASLAVSIIFFESQRKFEKTLDERDLKMKEEQQIKDERRHQEKIESEALYFIQKYNANDEIQLLALCVIASKFNSAFPYRRQIYKDFCCLNTEVQKSILKKMDIDLKLIELDSNNFFDNTLKMLEVDLKKQFPNNESFYQHWFYDGAKYYYRSLEYYKNEKVPEYEIANKKTILGNIAYKYDDIVTDILAKVDRTIELTNGNIINPSEISIDELFDIKTSDGSAVDGKEIVMSYLQCLIAKYVPVYLAKNNSNIEDVGYYSDYFTCNDDFYMEDLFLESILNINIYRTGNHDGLNSNGGEDNE